MTSSSNSPDSHLPSKTRNSKIDYNYLKELNEDLKLRKLELLEMLKPIEDKNNLLFQKLMSNLEEKQRSLQIMRQIMAGKGSEESSAMELIKEAEEMKQNLERKNKMLRKEMEMLWNKTFNTEELSDQQKAPQIKNKANLQDGKAPESPSSPRKTKNELETSFAEKVKEIRKEKQQRKIEWVRYQEQANNLQNDFNGNVIEFRIEALKNYQQANDLKLSLYLQQNFEPKQAFKNLPGSQEGTVGTTTMGKKEPNVRILVLKTYIEQQGTKGSQLDDIGWRLFFLRSLPDESLKNSKSFTPFAWTDLKTRHTDLKTRHSHLSETVAMKPQNHGQQQEEKPGVYSQDALLQTPKLVKIAL
ncbi:LOW QUALITY PROTEIN: putative coiled-coil domain-containing protein 196 [Molossus molossus]|uniref:LOW QUALITY PROTEIN: putative coiled-coil domain-containing protein 196 n=1 Tax=Molossus molossus TaxID=27622 RepID=UPI001745ED8B|nr:LOW QUALITY PROTEIN: putative coiled-coil domain-containing protein 196 [Molossus molossus]